MNSCFKQSKPARHVANFGSPKKRWQDYFAPWLMVGILAVGMPAASFAEEPTEPTEPQPTEPENLGKTIHGTITDANDNALGEVTVQVGEKTAVTDDEGKWEITGLSEGEHTIVASKEGYTFTPQDVTLSSDQEITLEIISAIFGTIVDISSHPIADVTVQVGDENTTTTNAEGQWEMTGLPAGEYAVTATKESSDSKDYLFGAQNLTLGELSTTEVKVGLIAGSGKIKNKFREPIAGATIRVYEKDNVSNDGLRATAVTDDEGNWQVSGLLAGEYTAVTSKYGYVFEQYPCKVNHNELCDSNFTKHGSVLEMTLNAPETVVQDGNVTYQITITNRGDKTASGIVVTDELPKGTELVSAHVSWVTYHWVTGFGINNGRFQGQGNTSACSGLICNLPSLSPAGTAHQTRSATVTIVVSNHQVEDLRNKVTMTSTQFPGDVQSAKTEVVPHFSIFITDNPDKVDIGGFLQYKVDIDLNPTVPDAATGVELKLQLPNGVEFQAVKTDYGVCDTNNLPTIVCSMADISLEQANSLSHTVGIDVVLRDVGLLLLTFEATVKANEYPAYTVRERTRINVPNAEEIKVDTAFVIDDTGSMQKEIDGVIAALKEYISQIGKKEPVTEEVPAEEETPAPTETPVTEDAQTSTETPVAEETQAPAETPVVEDAPTPAETPVAEDAQTPVDGEEQSSDGGEEIPVVEKEPLPPLFALVTFGDSVKVKAFTSDVSVLLEAVERLRAKGGASCPEASVEALNFVIPYVKEGGDILFTTDASPYPDADIEKLTELLRERSIRFNGMITGDCSDADSWNILTEEPPSDETPSSEPLSDAPPSEG